MYDFHGNNQKRFLSRLEKGDSLHYGESVKDNHDLLKSMKRLILTDDYREHLEKDSLKGYTISYLPGVHSDLLLSIANSGKEAIQPNVGPGSPFGMMIYPFPIVKRSMFKVVPYLFPEVWLPIYHSYEEMLSLSLDGSNCQSFQEYFESGYGSVLVRNDLFHNSMSLFFYGCLVDPEKNQEETRTLLRNQGRVLRKWMHREKLLRKKVHQGTNQMVKEKWKVLLERTQKVLLKEEGLHYIYSQRLASLNFWMKLELKACDFFEIGIPVEDLHVRNIIQFGYSPKMADYLRNQRTEAEKRTITSKRKKKKSRNSVVQEESPQGSVQTMSQSEISLPEGENQIKQKEMEIDQEIEEDGERKEMERGKKYFQNEAFEHVSSLSPFKKSFKPTEKVFSPESNVSKKERNHHHYKELLRKELLGKKKEHLLADHKRADKYGKGKKRKKSLLHLGEGRVYQYHQQRKRSNWLEKYRTNHPWFQFVMPQGAFDKRKRTKEGSPFTYVLNEKLEVVCSWYQWFGMKGKEFTKFEENLLQVQKLVQDLLDTRKYGSGRRERRQKLDLLDHLLDIPTPMMKLFKKKTIKKEIEHFDFSIVLMSFYLNLQRNLKKHWIRESDLRKGVGYIQRRLTEKMNLVEKDVERKLYEEEKKVLDFVVDLMREGSFHLGFLREVYYLPWEIPGERPSSHLKSSIFWRTLHQASVSHRESIVYKGRPKKAHQKSKMEHQEDFNSYLKDFPDWVRSKLIDYVPSKGVLHSNQFSSLKKKDKKRNEDLERETDPLEQTFNQVQAGEKVKQISYPLFWWAVIDHPDVKKYDQFQSILQQLAENEGDEMEKMMSKVGMRSTLCLSKLAAQIQKNHESFFSHQFQFLMDLFYVFHSLSSSPFPWGSQRRNVYADQDHDTFLDHSYYEKLCDDLEKDQKDYLDLKKKLESLKELVSEANFSDHKRGQEDEVMKYVWNQVVHFSFYVRQHPYIRAKKKHLDIPYAQNVSLFGKGLNLLSQDSLAIHQGLVWKRMFDHYWKEFASKEGRIRGKLISRRANFTGRSVIISGPELRLSECAIPTRLALVLFSPQLMSRLKPYMTHWFQNEDQEKNRNHGKNGEFPLQECFSLVDELLKVLESQHRSLNKREMVMIGEKVKKFFEMIAHDLEFEFYFSWSIMIKSKMKRREEKKGSSKIESDQGWLEKWGKEEVRPWQDEENAGEDCQSTLEWWYHQWRCQKKNFLLYVQNRLGTFIEEQKAITALVKEKEDVCEDATQILFYSQKFLLYLENLMSKQSVLLMRQPSLHRMSLQAFTCHLTHGSASISLNPLVCPPYNADFDGDTMSVFVPHSIEGQVEASNLLAAHQNLISPSTSKPIIKPTLDLLFGLYFLTSAIDDHSLERIQVDDFQMVDEDFSTGKLPFYQKISYQEHESTLGRFYLYSIIQSQIKIDFVYFNQRLEKNSITRLLTLIFQLYDQQIAGFVLDLFHFVGSRWAYRSGLTVNAQDFQTPPSKGLVGSHLKASLKYSALYGKSHERLMKKKSQELLTNVVQEDLESDLTSQSGQSVLEKPGVYLLIESGSRGSKSQLKQLSGTKGYVRNAKGQVVPHLIFNNLIDGLSEFEFLISSMGGRKGMVDRSLNTRMTGYLHRLFHTAMKNITITADDCFTSQGMGVGLVGGLRNEQFYTPCEQRFDDLLGRLLACSVNDPFTGEVLFEKNEMVTQEKISQLKEKRIDHLIIRSPLTCAMPKGVCQHCYGATDQSTLSLVPLGYPVGIIGAQAMGEPSTQLTMRTFHQGGVAASSGKAQGVEGRSLSFVEEGILCYDGLFLESLWSQDQQIFDQTCQSPLGRNQGDGTWAYILGEAGQVLQGVKIPKGSSIYVGDGEYVTKGQLIALEPNLLEENIVRVEARFPFYVKSITKNTIPGAPLKGKIDYVTFGRTVKDGHVVKKPIVKSMMVLKNDRIYVQEGQVVSPGDLIMEGSYVDHEGKLKGESYEIISKMLNFSKKPSLPLPVAYFDGFISFVGYTRKRFIIALVSDEFEISVADLLKHFPLLVATGVRIYCPLEKIYLRNLRDLERLEAKRGLDSHLLIMVRKVYSIPKKYAPFLRIRDGMFVEEGTLFMTANQVTDYSGLICFYGLDAAWEMIGKRILEIYGSAGIEFQTIYLECLMKELLRYQRVLKFSQNRKGSDKMRWRNVPKHDFLKDLFRLFVDPLTNLRKDDLPHRYWSDLNYGFDSIVPLRDVAYYSRSFFSKISFERIERMMRENVENYQFSGDHPDLFDTDINVFSSFPPNYGTAVRERLREMNDHYVRKRNN